MPSSAIAAAAAATCGGPPSTTTRFGGYANRAGLPVTSSMGPDRSGSAVVVLAAAQLDVPRVRTGPRGSAGTGA